MSATARHLKAWSWWGWPRSLPGGQIILRTASPRWCGPCAGALRTIPGGCWLSLRRNAWPRGRPLTRPRLRRRLVPRRLWRLSSAGLDYLLTRDLRPLLPGLPPGAVIIQGQEDRIVDPAQGSVLRDQLAGARLYDLPGAGHLPFLTQAPAFNRIIAECLSRVN